MGVELAPFVPFLVGALLVAILPLRLRQVVALLTPLAAGYLVWRWPGLGSEAALEQRQGYGPFALLVCKLDGLSAVFAGLFCFASFLASLFSLHVRDRIQTVASLIYAGSAVAAVGCGDLVSLFVAVEVMAVSSTFLIWARGGERALRAGMRYLLWQLLSGLLLLAGAWLKYRATGSLEMTALELGDPGALFLLASLGIKAAFPFVHVWLTDAYPEATPTGTVWLSAFTTKVAVYALARQFAGVDELIFVGAAMACFPIFYAVIENDLRRVLAYSLVNQVGFMVCGIGLGTDMALAGAVAHACNDVVFKGLLFMTMGAVLQQTGRIGGNELGGLFRSMPWTTGFCMVGAASISAFPLFSGFISKSMVMTAALDQGHGIVWLLLLFASAGVFHHAGIKIPYFAFFAHDSGLRPKEPPFNMLLAMGIAAGWCVLVGCVPSIVYDVLPWQPGYQPYDATHVIAQLQLLLWSALAFAWLQRTGLYPPELPSTNLDSDFFLRRAAPALGSGFARLFGPPYAAVAAAFRGGATRTFDGWMASQGPRGMLARTVPSDSMMLWMAMLLGLCLVLYYL
jgi:multicomponent Na+:H+ antiporter subunit D